MREAANRRQIIHEFVRKHRLAILAWQPDGTRARYELDLPLDRHDQDDTAIETPEGRLEWANISRVLERVERSDEVPRCIAFAEPRLPTCERELLSECLEAPGAGDALRAMLSSNPGHFVEGLRRRFDALDDPARTRMADAAIAALRHPDLDIPHLILAAGLAGAPRHLLALGDYLLEPGDPGHEFHSICQGSPGNHSWRWAFALAALRLAGTRDAYMQIQRACYEAPHPVVIDHARQVLLRVAGDQKKPIWVVQDDLVPSCGLDPEADGTFSWGDRHLVMHLDDELRPFLRDHDGNRRITELPSADETSAQATVRRRWDVVREQIAEAVPVQAHRFEEAFVQQHRWSFDEWRRNVLRHPLLIHLVQRVIWGTYSRSGTRLLDSFRVARDRSFWGADDEPWEPEDPLGIGIVHPLDMPAETGERWSSILADYEVVTLFPQVDRPTYAPPPDREKDAALQLDIQAPAKTVLQLHQRGWRDERGWSHTTQLVKGYRRRKVKARIHFDRDESGSTVLYRRLEFERYLSYPQSRFQLRDVSAVPYSEAVFDAETLRMPQETGGWAAVVAPAKS